MSQNNISSLRRETGPFRLTWTTKIYSEFIYVLYLLNHRFQSTPDVIVLKCTYYKLIESMGTVITDYKGLYDLHHVMGRLACTNNKQNPISGVYRYTQRYSTKQNFRIYISKWSWTMEAYRPKLEGCASNLKEVSLIWESNETGVNCWQKFPQQGETRFAREFCLERGGEGQPIHFGKTE